MKLNKEQYNKLLRNMYIADGGVVDFSTSANLYKDIMLITASCGRGKTTYSLSLSSFGLLEQINQERNRVNLFDKNLKKIEPDQVLFLTSRKSTKHQQLLNENTIQAIPNDFNNNMFDFEKAKRNGKIRVATAHQFGYWVKCGFVEIIPKIIILDELHSIISESIFAEELLYTIEFVKEHYEDIIKIGLTATPQFLYNYLEDNKFTFKVIDKNLNSKYKCSKIKAFVKGQGKTILKQIEPKINSNYKVIYYTQSATQCYKLAQEYGEKSAFLISDYNETVINDIKLTDLMNEQGVKSFILENEKLPDNIDIIFMNSSCREGMNIKDYNVKTIICESVDMITIEQILGRIRNDLEEFIVVCNNNNLERIKRDIQEFVEFADTLSNSANPNNELARRYGRQEENQQLQKYVYIYKGEYKLNIYAKSYLKYMYESYIQLNNFSENKYICRIGNRELMLSADYLSQLSRYSLDNTIDIERLWNGVVQYNHNNTIAKFQEIESQWINIPLTASDKKLLCAELHTIRSNGKQANWKTVKELLLNNGYRVIDKRVGKERKCVSIISK